MNASHPSFLLGRLWGAVRCMRPSAMLVPALASLLSSASAALAQEPGEAERHSDNVLAFFVGGAYEGSRDNGFALGVEYERRLNEAFGIGALAEHTFGDLDTWVFAIPVAYHAGPWKLYVAPGRESGEVDNEFLMRIGAEHGFEIGEWEIAPQIDIDFISGEETFVVGVTFGRGL